MIKDLILKNYKPNKLFTFYYQRVKIEIDKRGLK